MAHPEPHPRALFSLAPLTERADAVLAHPSNAHLLSRLIDGTLVLDIGHVRSICADNTTLATMGRTGDVIVEGANISKVQCSFEINRDSKAIMFCDKSVGQTSSVSGENAVPFEHGRPRRVVVQDNINTIIGMDGVGRNLVQFKLKWHHERDDVVDRVKCRENFPLEENPRFAGTVDETKTILPTGRQTRIHTEGPPQKNIIYIKESKVLGSGNFGQVYKAMNVDSGGLIAVKIVQRQGGSASHEEWTKLKGEIETLSRISHVDYISSQGWDNPRAEIFMGLKEGTLQSLMAWGKLTIRVDDLARTVFHHMLQAIDYLAVEGIVHRDVKPENILYTSHHGEYQFQLGDFGLSQRANVSTAFAGSPLYMAPETRHEGPQTHKADVWSLFVTILWTLDGDGFRTASAGLENNRDEVQRVVASAAETDTMWPVREMARVDPEQRASAAQMLVKIFQGEGLVTPQSRVRPLLYLETAGIETPVAATGRPTWLAQLKTATTQKNTRRSATTGQYRGTKARFAGVGKR